MNPTLVLVGPHGAGKTTLGRRVAARLGVSFEHELGAELRREALARDASRHAMLAQEDFDAEVMRRELARDLEVKPGAGRVVETWHPGNLAYAARRSPGVAARYRQRLGEHLETWRPVVVVQPLTVSFETALARLSEPGPDAESLVAFFRAVGDDAVREARGLGLVVLPTLSTDAASPDDLAEEVVHSLAACATMGRRGRRRLVRGARVATTVREATSRRTSA